MKCFIVLFALVALAAAETYSNENDNVDIEAIVSDQKSLQAFLDCFIDSKPCNDVQADFKNDLSEVFQQACAKCTAAQKHLLKRFLEALKEKLPKGFSDFQQKYDPEGKYLAPLEAAIANA